MAEGGLAQLVYTGVFGRNIGVDVVDKLKSQMRNRKTLTSMWILLSEGRRAKPLQVLERKLEYQETKNVWLRRKSNSAVARKKVTPKITLSEYEIKIKQKNKTFRVWIRNNHFKNSPLDPVCAPFAVQPGESPSFRLRHICPCGGLASSKVLVLYQNLNLTPNN